MFNLFYPASYPDGKLSSLQADRLIILNSYHDLGYIAL